ncbi:rRNA metabolism protein [Sulfodiicoccus acidiphilus]|uniref:rRNA metabolism protein n=1 Tax=Sulfodiicoccus acidiphilus TaxID=1670455 RepID=A0A348B126_9CREN|nr:ribosome assembly factor SBDS [Sulfodiicoccus acidiphilus]BBD71878.1 rRNA metabolism protein [Sulfodiicoccus acidiphilus]GGT91156.1 rRNA metabolism protein [Sulfodiicoccus acidiphilus]
MPKENYVVVKYESHGERFEVLAKPKEVSDLKEGKSISLSDVVVSDIIYKDARKGLKASPASMKKVFGTTDFETVAREILIKGEIPLTADQRKEILESKRKQLVTFISRNCIDPKTKLPIPPTRIESAMEAAKVHVDPNKDVESQAIQIVRELAKVMPIKLAKALVELRVPSAYAAKVKSQLPSMGEVKKTNWLADGSLTAEMEIPAGAQGELIDKINSLTKGEAEVRIAEVR